MKIINGETKKIEEDFNNGVEAIIILDNNGIEKIEIEETDKIKVQGTIVTITPSCRQFNINDVIETFSLTGKNTRYNLQIGW